MLRLKSSESPMCGAYTQCQSLHATDVRMLRVIWVDLAAGGAVDELLDLTA